MIDFLHGELVEKTPDSVVIRVGGMGMRVRVPTSTYDALPREGAQARVLTYLHVREDELSLYGFAQPVERDLFRMLLGVSQVGPSVAMNVLSSCPPESFKRYIMDEDDKAIAALVKGIGPKTARRLIVELQSRMKNLAVQAAEGASDNQVARDAVEALVTLGTSRAAAEKAVREALKRLGPDVDQQTLMHEAVSG